MLKMIMLLLIVSLLLWPGACRAEKSAVLVVVDGLGSTYVYPGQVPACIDGSPLDPVHLSIVDDASARYELWVPTPETEAGNSVIATGYSGASEESLSYYDSTIYDALRADGYLTIAVLETGDNEEMIAEPDIVVYEQNNSVLAPSAVTVMNAESVPAGIKAVLESDPPRPVKKGTDHVAAYRQYDEWSLEKAAGLVRYLAEARPGQKYLLVVSVAGADMAAHEDGFDCYRQVIASLDAPLAELANVCRNAGTAVVITADHGMSFRSSGSKGTHASGEAALRNESRLAPLLIFSNATYEPPATYGQECVAPTLLTLMGCPYATSVQDGRTLVVGAVSPVPLTRTTTSGPRSQGWLPYAAIAAFVAAGIAVALHIMRR